MRRISDVDESWEYVGRPTVIEWAQEHIALAVAGAALIWFGVVYVMTLVVDLFVR
jgi:hypothetical protein